MASSLQKFSIVYKDCQSGKTFEQFLRVREEANAGKELFYIFFTDNFKLQSSQLDKRFRAQFPDKGLPIQVNSGFKYSTRQRRTIPVAEQNCAEYHEVANILLDCPNRDTLMILSNTFRTEDLVCNLDKWCRAGGYEGVQVWFDEIDRTTSLFSDTIPALNEHPCVNKIVGMTGTGLQHLFNHLQVNTLDLLSVSRPHEDFMGFKEHQFRNVEMDLDDTKLFSILDPYSGYAGKVLGADNFVRPGVCAFVPSHPWCAKQRSMTYLLATYKFDVIVRVNGEEKIVFRKIADPKHTVADFDRLLDFANVNDEHKFNAEWDELRNEFHACYDSFSLSESEHEPLEFSLAKLSRENNWTKLSVAVTGHNCLTRGVTLQSKDFVFTHAILPLLFTINASDAENDSARKRADEYYQLCARINGSTRPWNNDTGVKIYTSSESQAFLQGYSNIPQDLTQKATNGKVSSQQYGELLGTVFQYVDKVGARRGSAKEKEKEKQTVWRYNLFFDTKQFQDKVGVSLDEFCTKPARHFQKFLGAFDLVSDTRGPNGRPQIQGHFTGSISDREGILCVDEVRKSVGNLSRTSTALFDPKQIAKVRQEYGKNGEPTLPANKCATRIYPCYIQQDGPLYLGMSVVVSGSSPQLDEFKM